MNAIFHRRSKREGSNHKTPEVSKRLAQSFTRPSDHPVNTKAEQEMARIQTKLSQGKAKMQDSQDSQTTIAMWVNHEKEAQA